MELSESHPLIRVRRRLGKVRRWIKRRWWHRITGREYRAWLGAAAAVQPGSVDNQFPIAVIVPVYNPPVNLLEACLASVLAQSARNWQLIVVDDGSTDEDVREFLGDFEGTSADDSRVIVLHESNGGISSAINAGLARVTCSRVGWLDHDDYLDPRCFAEFSAVLAATNADIVYSDEDKVDEQGRHFEYYAKPDFSPELLLTQMYLCHFTVFPTDQLRAIGGFRPQMDGAQDFDVALRLLPHISRVEHIPRPLYHWRWWSQSTAQSIDAKPWALEATTRVQREHLERTFGGGEVTPGAVRGLNDVHPRVAEIPLVSVIIPTAGVQTHDGERCVDRAIASLRAVESQVPLQVIVVTTGELEPIPGADVTVVYQPSGGFNFSAAINVGRTAAQGDYLLLLNDDTEAITPNPVLRLLELGQIPGVGITGCALEYPDGRIQHAGISLIPSGPTHCWIGHRANETGYFGSLLTPRNYSAVTAAAMLVRTDVFDAVNGFDETFARDFNDVDFCLRVQAQGMRVAWTPYARFLHFEGTSLRRRVADQQESVQFQARWAAKLERDPYYSPSLSNRLERLYDPR